MQDIRCRSLRQVMREIAGTYSKKVPLLPVDRVVNEVLEGTIDALRDAVKERSVVLFSAASRDCGFLERRRPQDVRAAVVSCRRGL